MRLILVFTLVCRLSGAMAQGTDLGWLRGEIKDAVSREVLPFAKVQVLCGPELWEGMTDFDGQFIIRVPYGPVVITVDSEGYRIYRTTGTVERTSMTFLNVAMERMKTLR